MALAIGLTAMVTGHTAIIAPSHITDTALATILADFTGVMFMAMVTMIVMAAVFLRMIERDTFNAYKRGLGLLYISMPQTGSWSGTIRFRDQ